MPGFLPEPTDVDRPYWRPADDGVLRLQKCAACGDMPFPPARRCVACGSRDLNWTALSGEGVIWSFVVMRKQYFPDMPTPYVVIRVKLAEGPYLMANLVGSGDREPAIGAPVRVVFERAGDIVLTQFTLI